MWTAIVPAAGKASRLTGSPIGGKMYYSVAGKMIYEYWLELLSPYCDQIVVVGRPGQGLNIPKVLDVVQPKPVGTLDAVQRGVFYAANELVIVLWGDKITITPKTLEATMTRCVDSGRGVVPTVPRCREPYTEIVRSPSGGVVKIHQKSAGIPMRTVAESDIGLFAFQRFQLERGLTLAEGCGHTDFLRVFEYVNCSALPIATELEAVSINTPADVERVEHEWAAQ